MAAGFQEFCKRLIAPERWRDVDSQRQARRVAAFDLAMLVWVLVFAPTYIALGASACAIVLAVAGLVLILILVALARGYSPTLCGNIFCCDGLYAYTTLAYLNGGREGPSVMWYATMPIIAVYMCGLRWGVFWTFAAILAVTGLALADYQGIECPNLLTPNALRLLEYLGRVGLICCLCILVGVLTRIERRAQQELYEANCRLEFQSSVDGLTGVANRRSFDQMLETQWQRHERVQQPLSVVLIDIDWFKQYNDSYGHLAGDDVVRAMAQVIQSSVPRPDDFVARFGGDEFAVILPHTNKWQAEHVASQIRRDVQALSISHRDSTTGSVLTISIGIGTAIPTSDGSPADLVQQADQGLYLAKDAGRDRMAQGSGLSHNW
jgi:diguanylate cyclase (GGDEF)-like protein